jgi:hypothetical protein
MSCLMGCLEWGCAEQLDFNLCILLLVTSRLPQSLIHEEFESPQPFSVIVLEYRAVVSPSRNRGLPFQTIS